jgi:hypothetical protein
MMDWHDGEEDEEEAEEAEAEDDEEEDGRNLQSKIKTANSD